MTRIARVLMLAQIQHHAPELLDAEATDGSRFTCSEVFVKKFVFAKDDLGFSSTNVQGTPAHVE